MISFPQIARVYSINHSKGEMNVFNIHLVEIFFISIFQYLLTYHLNAS